MAEKLTIVLEALNRASGPIKELSADVAQATGQIKKDYAGAFEMAGAAGRTMQGVGAGITAMGAGILSIGTIAVSAAGQMERYSAQFEVLTGSAQGAKDRLAQLTTFAATTPFELSQVIEADKLIQSFDMDIGGVEKTLRLVGDASSAMGVPMDQTIRVLAKMKAGMFDLGEAAPIGITREKLQALGVQFSETGEILNRDALFPATIKLLERFGGTMEKVSKTTEGQLSNLKDSFFQMMAALGTGLTPLVQIAIPPMQMLAGAIQKIAENPVGKVFIAGAAGVGVLMVTLGPLVMLAGTLLTMLPSLAAGWAMVNRMIQRNAIVATEAAVANAGLTAASQGAAIAGGAGGAAGGAKGLLGKLAGGAGLAGAGKGLLGRAGAGLMGLGSKFFLPTALAYGAGKGIEYFVDKDSDAKLAAGAAAAAQVPQAARDRLARLAARRAAGDPGFALPAPELEYGLPELSDSAAYSAPQVGVTKRGQFQHDITLRADFPLTEEWVDENVVGSIADGLAMEPAW